MTILKFSGSLVRSLLLGMPFKNLKIGARQQSTSQSKRKLVDHKLEEREESSRDVRRHYDGCYAKTRQQPSKETSNATVNAVNTFCFDSDKFYCFGCFNKKHHSV